MTRHRARPSFTVEVKRTRNTPLGFHEDPDRQRAAQTLWKGTALGELTARAHVLEAAFAVAAPEPEDAGRAAVRARAAESPAARRVLPSLIEPVRPEPEPEPVAEAEAPLPRVRRLGERVPKMPRARETAPLPVREARPARAAKAITPEPPAPAPTPPAATPTVAESGAELVRRRSRYGEKSELRAGERWKRRLPRVCW